MGDMLGFQEKFNLDELSTVKYYSIKQILKLEIGGA